MEISLGSAFLAVFAVSGSVAFLAMKVNEHLLSDFINKLEIEIDKDQAKKKVMFSNKVVELGSHSKDIKFDDYISMKNYVAESSISSSDESLKSMPLNWQVLYKGILNDKITLRGYD
ncbi:hypothetical protein CQW23_24631 [Capsicum baccatum]|uniref:Uncharacterized protein n=1 Tax=Capsicum baccatum TaxID=33114 RepID=A0A2G2VVE8_CAPBA|nr:hypothetical protein CQW23_24631 [Capsicum baccatum]